MLVFYVVALKPNVHGGRAKGELAKVANKMNKMYTIAAYLPLLLAKKSSQRGPELPRRNSTVAR